MDSSSHRDRMGTRDLNQANAFQRLGNPHSAVVRDRARRSVARLFAETAAADRNPFAPTPTTGETR